MVQEVVVGGVSSFACALFLDWYRFRRADIETGDVDVGGIEKNDVYLR